MNDLNLKIAIFLCANCAEVNIGDVGNLVRGKGLGGLEDLVGDALGGGGTVGQVVLHTKILVRACNLVSTVVVPFGIPPRLLTSGVVAGGEQDTASSLPDPDDMAGSRGRENAVLADQQLLDAVGSTDLGDLLCDLRVPVATVTTDNEESVLSALRNRLEDADDEGFGVVLLLEDLDLLAKTRTGSC